MPTMLISRDELTKYLVRAEMAAEVTLPADSFRDLVLQAMLSAAPAAPSQDALDDAAYLDWVQKNNMALIPPEHGGHGWMVVQYARAVGGKYIAGSENPRHDPRALRTAIKKAIAALRGKEEDHG